MKTIHDEGRLLVLSLSVERATIRCHSKLKMTDYLYMGYHLATN